MQLINSHIHIYIFIPSSGIGFETARILYHRGAKVYIAARNTEKANNCIQRIENEKVNHSQGQEHGKVLFHHLELADPGLAKKSAEEFLKKEDRLDVLSMSSLITMNSKHKN